VYVSTKPLIPASCCINGSFLGCTSTITNATLSDETLVKQHIYTSGCLPKVVADIAISKIGTIGIVLAIIELVGVVFACFMARSIRYSYETV